MEETNESAGTRDEKTEQWTLGTMWADGHPRWQLTYDALCKALALMDIAEHEVERHDDSGDLRGLGEVMDRASQLVTAAMWGLNGPKGERLEILQTQVYGRPGQKRLAARDSE